ncbi:winged helix-turn-helix domain-containing protein [Dyella sp.]|uniref:winged helix-turn-helix domain-containing protein n=1 Tax=Dyella sp. TaxID=1869338 RepID=UPI002B48A85B|nr:winged helix-turn-helix domain-containing protein [Dyella sp.]HKT26599.1 winged helix-turn-helix domain-containing protein [Dyella sp.]
MGTPVYYFGDFSLNPLARELRRSDEPVVLAASAFDCLVYLIEHRERPVGRDELISAVWGRADVSDNLLAQTIVRLRRALGDAGNEQQCIKTMARVGYRWMPDTTVVQAADAPVSTREANDASAAVTGDVAVTPQRVRRPLWIALLLTVIVAVGYALWQFSLPRQAPPAVHFNQGTAIVLPAEVKAPDDWQWLHLGLMDLVSTQLRQAQVPTENSRDVLNLLRQADTASSAQLAPFALVVTPHVALMDNRWHVHLDAKAKDGRDWQAESSSEDVLAAARAASDLLLTQLGFNTQPRNMASGESQQEYLLRIQAAQLAGQPDLAHQLIDKAPPSLRNTPELAFAQAQLYCVEGNIDACESSLTDLRKRLSPTTQPLLRGKVLTSLWFPYRRRNQLDKGEAALDEAVRLLQGQKDADALAEAYLDRSHLETYQGKLDEASTDLGHARIQFALAGDTIGQARVDRAMGELAIDRGQFGAALPLLQHAYEQYQRMGMRQLLSSALDAMADAQSMSLQYADELATTDRFWPFDQKHMDFIDPYTRHQLSKTRAIALADNGRTADATSLLESVLTDANGNEEAGLRAETRMLLAKFALQRGDDRAALTWISKALEGSSLAQHDQRDYAEGCYLQAVALQRAGQTDELKRAVTAMQTWVSALPKPDDWIAIWLLRAKAVQAWGEGQRDQVLAQLRLAMAAADASGVPEFTVGVGQSYALALLATGHTDQAAAVSGQLSTWSNVDWRAAEVEASVFQALGQGDQAQTSWNKARKLAGDRPVQTPAAPVF